MREKFTFRRIVLFLILCLIVIMGNQTASHISHKLIQVNSNGYIVLEKSPDRDFIILNLTDTQLYDYEWTEGSIKREVLEYTITELINKVQTDLITISGDLAWYKQFQSYQMLADFIDRFNIPWAFVWGNHDNENLEYCIESGSFNSLDFENNVEKNTQTALDYLEKFFEQYNYCLFTKGPEEFGSGNYIISIEQNSNPITGIFMMDTYNKDTYLDEDGNAYQEYSSLNDKQKNGMQLMLNI